MDERLCNLLDTPDSAFALGTEQMGRVAFA